jgi:hypothetical protein
MEPQLLKQVFLSGIRQPRDDVEVRLSVDVSGVEVLRGTADDDWASAKNFP